MGVPIQQVVGIGSYLVKQRLLGRKRFPLVLMLEPLFRCNLACTGCGKIQHPVEILKQNLSPEDCFRAAEECGAPVVSIPGGEPLLHPQIGEIVQGLIDRKKFIYLCTNGILLEKSLDKFKPSPYFTFMVHLDGMRDWHDQCVDRKGVFDTAVKAIKAAKARGFQVNTNTTIFEGANPEEMHEFFDFLTELGVDGMQISPGYSYEWAPDQDHFLKREQTHILFRQILAPMKKGKKWNFSHNPLFLDFLMGEKDYECTPWGSPSYSVLGWQKPCYLLNDGYYKTFQELLDKTDWSQYGRKSGNPNCADCMVHCGYEPTAAIDAMQPHNIGRAMTSVLGK
ncbi:MULTISPECIES: adenosyl-hopene transferase HpnH [Leptolyngbya]|jgi:hopanoid biosynthesis associated radical SAM protein HpnH|uniref:Radical SAM domain-containing protein n=2 Tax=Leptolyngbya boryana TaxID=1184 RepID=A0A1Z4JDH6_LEPBY|nr:MULTISPECIES: adenosyl-hopene transferase HpnH [Leptolyngbya]BAY54791.1 radical SAM domain-containing protein [Leptolyngbya boryana NIES-2135]MBD1854102.1 adenosyl-hopene transferase HpnH [Leptolyngbya sp. FACHB-1624]MBD2365774.1 adenosyl-hopene transferase HpnH [Leptolyngbya sp. FACHB-161]MBD2371954.1 adenosyl-hopene transferase HpnH [Leptolyngbya sp. FACHB-238]MBD2396379.1 adenosyl-hopene transferase HpnH [Leptolyngbya sp. FACHB-239]